jgi:hypothetical protein
MGCVSWWYISAVRSRHSRFLGSDSQPPPTAVIVLMWWLVFRLEFGAGMIKIRGGRESHPNP